MEIPTGHKLAKFFYLSNYPTCEKLSSNDKNLDIK